MKKTYSFEPELNIGDTVYIITFDVNTLKHEVTESKIDDIRYLCADNTIEYSTEDRDHFEGLGWFDKICFDYAKDYNEESIGEDTIFIRREDAEIVLAEEYDEFDRDFFSDEDRF